MSTAKAKFELYTRLQNLGFTYEEAVSLRRIEMTLQRWAEAECGDSNDYCSWSVERDETTGKPYCCRYPHDGKMTRYPIADREAGALRRLKAIVDARNLRAQVETFPGGSSSVHGRNEIIPYHQGDPRGCMLYLVKRSVIEDQPIDQVYTRGLAVCC